MKKTHILLVENNTADVMVMKLVFNESGNKDVFVVSDGQEALRFLRKEGLYAGKQRPDYIVLDLNMPGMDGRMFLKEIRKDTAINDIPVVVFTSSESAQDASESADMGVHYYVRKPLDLDEFAMAVENIDMFWLKQISPKASLRR